MAINLATKKILVTGGAGFLGSHLVEKLIAHGVSQSDITVPDSRVCDLRVKENCVRAVENQDIVIHLAAKAGGIGLNRAKPGELFYDNIVMGAYLMESARTAGVSKFVAIATICAYPKFTPVPFREEYLWEGYPEETNAPYGLAKKMLLVQAQAYRKQYGMNIITLFPVNMYGSRDNFNPDSSHVLPALIQKISEAKKKSQPFIEVWGSGTPTREFLYVEDAAEWIVLATEQYDKADPVNLAPGMEISIKDLVTLVCRFMDYTGEIRWDFSKPDGQPRRMLDISRAVREIGLIPITPFEEGLRKTIEWYNKNNG